MLKVYEMFPMKMIRYRSLGSAPCDVMYVLNPVLEFQGLPSELGSLARDPVACLPAQHYFPVHTFIVEAGLILVWLNVTWTGCSAGTVHHIQYAVCHAWREAQHICLLAVYIRWAQDSCLYSTTTHCAGRLRGIHTYQSFIPFLCFISCGIVVGITPFPIEMYPFCNAVTSEGLLSELIRNCRACSSEICNFPTAHHTRSVFCLAAASVQMTHTLSQVRTVWEDILFLLM